MFPSPYPCPVGLFSSAIRLLIPIASTTHTTYPFIPRNRYPFRQTASTSSAPNADQSMTRTASTPEPVSNTLLCPIVSQRRKWTQAEDNILRCAVQRAIGRGETPPWTRIGIEVGRRGSGVFERWTRICSGRERGPFTEAEDSIIAEEVRQRTSQNQKPRWAAIGRQLCRPRADVIVRWRNYLNPALKHSEVWTAEEDHEIRLEASRAAAAARPPRWTSLAKSLPHRSGRSISNRWHRVLSPHIITKGKFSEKECNYIKRCVHEAEKDARSINWGELARTMGRTGSAILNHWQRTLDPRLIRGSFSSTEDNIIRAGRAGGLSFAEIGRKLQRSRAAVRGHWIQKLKTSIKSSEGAAQTR